MWEWHMGDTPRYYPRINFLLKTDLSNTMYKLMVNWQKLPFIGRNIASSGEDDHDNIDDEDFLETNWLAESVPVVQYSTVQYSTVQYSGSEGPVNAIYWWRDSSTCGRSGNAMEGEIAAKLAVKLIVGFLTFTLWVF